MAKDRYAVTCNGRTAFYACMYEDIRHCAMDCGWAVSLHGSLSSDMDIMAMPWVDNAVSFKEMVDRVSKLFKDNDMSSQYVITYNEKPYNRVVATIPIFADFYLDISTITADVTDVVRCKDCKHWTPMDNGISWHHQGRTDGECENLWQLHCAERHLTDQDHFCSYGERKE